MTTPLSTFVQQMQDLLDRITSAREQWEREQAEREMADLIRQHSGARRTRTFDARQAQTGERE